MRALRENKDACNKGELDKWLEKAVELDHAPAAFNLYDLYRFGKILPRSQRMQEKCATKGMDLFGSGVLEDDQQRE